MSKNEQMAAIGRLGGLVKTKQPEDFVRGNPQAKKLAMRLGKEKQTRAVATLYELNPAISIWLTEAYLNETSELRDDRTDEAKAAAAAEKVIKTLRDIAWKDHGKKRTLMHIAHEAMIYTSAMMLVGMVQDGPSK